jgi:iron complex outermembrane receptor protein
VHEGERFVLPDDSVRIPGWTRADLAVAFNAGALTWRAGVDNLFDKRAWRESPYQFGHAYLYPLEGRALRVALQIDM